MLTEAEVEAVLLDQLSALGYACLNDAVSGPDGSAPERDAYSDTFLPRRLRAAIARLNPQIPEDAREDALRRVMASDRPSLIEENRRLHRAMVDPLCQGSCPLLYFSSISQVGGIGR
ncbi:type I site-specific restriction-modification system R (restriction) subunit [Rhodobacteraceae bacterium MBR-64]|jgi:type I restriction enzyme R subunit